MSKKQVCLFQWDCNENENDNGKIDHKNQKEIDLYIHIGLNTQNTECLGKTMSLCNKQHLGNTWGSIHEKVKQQWVEKKRCL